MRRGRSCMRGTAWLGDNSRRGPRTPVELAQRQIPVGSVRDLPARVVTPASVSLETPRSGRGRRALIAPTETDLCTASHAPPWARANTTNLTSWGAL